MPTTRCRRPPGPGPRPRTRAPDSLARDVVHARSGLGDLDDDVGGLDRWRRRARRARGRARRRPRGSSGRRSGTGPHWSSTWAITPSRTTRVTRPVRRLRADSRTTGTAAASGADDASSSANRASTAPSTTRRPAASCRRLQSAGLGPAAHRVVADAEQLRGLTHPIERHGANTNRRCGVKTSQGPRMRSAGPVKREIAGQPSAGVSPSEETSTPAWAWDAGMTPSRPAW